MSAPAAVIWDLDGVLLDTEPLYLAVERAIAAKFGKDTQPLLPRLLGLPGLRVATLIVQELQLPLTPAEFLAQRDAQLATAFREVQPCVGALDLARHLRALGLQCAIATSSTRAMLDVKRAAHPELFDNMHAVVCADDVAEAKPAPLLFLEAARRLQVPPELCVVFEDAPAGVMAAKAAGMRCIALRNPHVEAKLYADAGAHFVVQSGSLRDFDNELLALPKLGNGVTL